MPAVPSWVAATPGQMGQSGQANQFLGAHPSTIVYTGALGASQTTGAAVYSDTASQWLSQTIVTGSSQTSIGYVLLALATVGGSPSLPTIPALTIGLYSDANGLPNLALASTTVTDGYVYLAPYWVMVPLPIAGLTAATSYHLVATMTGTSGAYYTWERSTQTVGAANSADGTSWAAQSYGLMFQVYDQTATGPVQLIYDDAGARWMRLTYTSLGLIAGISEYTAAQNSGALQSQRSLTYSNGLLTGVS